MLRHALLAGLLLLALAAPAVSRDFEEEGRVRDAEALIAKLGEAQKARNDGSLRGLLAEVPALHNKLRTRAAMQRLQKAIASVLEDGELNTTAHLAAVDAAAQLHDDKGVWSLLKKALPDFRPTPLDTAVADALGMERPQARPQLTIAQAA